MPTTLTPQDAWTRLVAGNERYAAGASRHDHQDPARRAQLAGGQDPFALVFGCSDSRVPAEVVFDQGLGDLFVVRTAGHIVDSAVLGSVEFGVDGLAVPLVVVMGHTSCGAVAATIHAIDGHHTPSGYLRDIVERVSPAVFDTRREEGADATAITAENVRNTCRTLIEKSASFAQALYDGRAALVGALYDIVDGTVTAVDFHGPVSVDA